MAEHSAAVPATGLARLHPLQTVLLVAAVFIGSQMAAGLIVLLLQSATSRLLPSVAAVLNSSTLSQFVLIFFVEVLAIIGVALVLRRNGARLQDIGLTRPRGIDAVLSVIGFVAYFGIFLLLATGLKSLLPGLDTEQRQDIGFEDAIGPAKLVLVFLALVVLAPLAEEILFRGLLFTGLRKRLRFVGAMAITSLLFGLAHIFGGEEGASLLWIAGLDTLVLSIVLCYLREKTGRLWAPILLHAIKNSFAFLVLFVITECPSCGFSSLWLM